MKKVITLFLIKLTLLSTAFSQNVGIGTTSPQSKLDINGDIALRSADLTIGTTYTYALNVNAVKQSNYKLKPAAVPVGNFILAGITAGVEGRLITLTNRTPNSMEIYNEDVNATAANRIQTGTGNTVAIYPNGNVTLQYDATDQRWSVKSMHNNSLDYFGGGGGGTSYWDLSGVNISSTNTGNVGIGTASPNKKLDVRGSASVTGNSLNSTTSTGIMEISSSDVTGQQVIKIDGQRIQSIGSNNIAVLPTARTLLINPYGGNVGIGLNSPSHKLTILSSTVEADNNNTNVLQIAGKNPVLNISEVNGTPYGYIKGVTDLTKTPQFPGPGLEIGAVPGTDLFLSANYAPVLTVKQNNTVGIGTTNPTSPLSFPNVFGKKISFWNATETADYGMGIASGTLQVYTTVDAQIAFGYGTSNSFTKTMTFSPGSAQLGINCLPQAGYQLAVKGHVRSTEIVVETGWADYVFDKTYKLKPLAELEDFIKQNNHLPNIPSAMEIQKDGLKVGEVQTKMIEKIEELTLYVIALKKEIELLKSKK